MDRTDPEEYRRMHELREDEPIPPVEISYGYYECQEEYDKQDEACFIRTAALFFLGEITLEEYFDRLIGHLEVDAERHSFDNSQSTKWQNFLKVDLISGAVKVTMLNPSFQPLSPTEADNLKKLSVLTYHTQDGESLRQAAAVAGSPLPSLPPHWLDILVIIAYARRHVSALSHLVTYPSPAQTTFDLFPGTLIAKRREPDMRFQHSPDTPLNRITEINLWTAILTAPPGRSWVHLPMSEGTNGNGLYWGLHWLLDFWEHDAELRSADEVEGFCRLFSRLDIVLSACTVARFLSLSGGSHRYFEASVRPCGAPLAHMLLGCFPIARIKASAADNPDIYGPGQWADILLPVTQWGRDNPDRLVVMRMLLEQGCDPNDKIHDWGIPSAMTDKQFDTALHLAAELGDGDMVRLLLEFGARNDLGGSGGDGDTPAERARVNGFVEVAKMIDG